ASWSPWSSRARCSLAVASSGLLALKNKIIIILGNCILLLLASSQHSNQLMIISTILWSIEPTTTFQCSRKIEIIKIHQKQKRMLLVVVVVVVVVVIVAVPIIDTKTE